MSLETDGADAAPDSVSIGRTGATSGQSVGDARLSQFAGLSVGRQEKRESTGCAADWITDELLTLAGKLKTIVPKGTWESLGSENEIAEENGYNVKKRPQVRVSFEVRRDVLLHQRMVHTSYLTKEASEDSRDQRGTTSTMYDVARHEVDTGVQAVTPVVDNTAQTPFSRRVDAAMQVQPILVDACIRNITVPRNEDPAMTAFFLKVLPRTLHCLLQNYEVPIYQDEFTLFTEDDAIVGSRDDTVLIEKGNYTHTTMKDLRVSSISWRSFRPKDDFVCMASVSRYTYEERIEAERRCETAINLVWDFADPMHPRAFLEAPVEIQVLRFNPLKPNYIVGGAMNGQLFLWDLNRMDTATVSSTRVGIEHMEDQNVVLRAEPGTKDIPPMALSVKGVSTERDGDVLVPRLQPVQSSRVELSHRRPVHAIQWVPDGLECGFDGKQTATQEGRQFFSLSDDGYMCVWDIRADHLPPDKLRKIKHQGRVGGEEFPWVPLLRYQLSRPGGGAEVMGFRFQVDGLDFNETPSYVAVCGTTLGEVVMCSTHTPDERREFTTHADETRVVRLLAKAHAGPVYSIRRHPLISDVYLSCGDLHFKLWRVGLDRPIFISSQHDAPVTCACWAPLRASVVVVGTMDGKIIVWDLLDRNREPLLVHQLVQDAITVINFKPVPPVLPPNYVQCVAIGTSVGSFHWYALPKVLSRGPSGEQRHFRAMLEREVRRVHYYSWRWSERERERDRYGVAAPKMLGKASSIVASAEEKAVWAAEAFEENFYAYDHHRDKEFLEKVAQPMPEAEKMEMDDAAEEEEAEGANDAS
ncbi:flagellar inner dynein arm I1 intermediate chain IC140 [Trypanosoma conorhini]|uniref:Flagellar inner dynein arm I1 intermediate chain IC140 n=1 Tax=Trypanosoma conorhini TaxID=83891 RepID=A0A422PBG6_9TRYP|nr:flagellar inner dynein arm I1 intermediate chain IC140 [Trypanosoma conorhini]RNF15060.1 flagellar inner dynein arm I1 intermediate chain IC140 [Trypanosoma conorhini]